MKKTIISLAVAAGMAASGVAFAEATVYGLINLSIDSPDNDTAAGVANTDSLTMNNQTSDIGIKGSEDLGDGMKAFYKVEFQIDPSERAKNITDRDQYIGLKGGMGTVKFGTASSNYKQKGGSVDPMYRTSLEGRGALNMQSELHGGAGRFGGRMTDMVQYSSPKMGGMQLVLNTTFDDADTTGVAPTDIDETIGVGFRYEAKAFSFYVDMIDVSWEDNPATAPTITADTVTGDLISTANPGDDVVMSESATKIGGTFKAGPVKLGIQLEQTEDLIGADYTMVSANYAIDKNNAVYFAYGTMGDSKGSTTADGTSSVALMYNHNMSKMTNVYVGYGSRSEDDTVNNTDYSVMTAGMRVKF